MFKTYVLLLVLYFKSPKQFLHTKLNLGGIFNFSNATRIILARIIYILL